MAARAASSSHFAVFLDFGFDEDRHLDRFPQKGKAVSAATTISRSHREKPRDWGIEIPNKMAGQEKPETEFLHVTGVSCVQTVFYSLTPFLGLPIATVLRQNSLSKVYSSTNPNLSVHFCKYLSKKNEKPQPSVFVQWLHKLLR